MKKNMFYINTIYTKKYQKILTETFKISYLHSNNKSKQKKTNQAMKKYFISIFIVHFS